MSGNGASDPVTTEWEQRNGPLVDYFLGNPDRLNNWLCVVISNLAHTDPVSELEYAIERNAIVTELSNLGWSV